MQGLAAARSDVRPDWPSVGKRGVSVGQQPSFNMRVAANAACCRKTETGAPTCSGGAPVMVCVLPEPVCPYASADPL